MNFVALSICKPCPRRFYCFHLHLECLPHGWPFTTHVFHVFLPFAFMLQKLLLIPSTSYVGLFREHIVLRCFEVFFIPRGRKELVHKHCQQNWCIQNKSGNAYLEKSSYRISQIHTNPLLTCFLRSIWFYVNFSTAYPCLKRPMGLDTRPIGHDGFMPDPITLGGSLQKITTPYPIGSMYGINMVTLGVYWW